MVEMLESGYVECPNCEYLCTKAKLEGDGKCPNCEEVNSTEWKAVVGLTEIELKQRLEWQDEP